MKNKKGWRGLLLATLALSLVGTVSAEPQIKYFFNESSSPTENFGDKGSTFDGDWFGNPSRSSDSIGGSDGYSIELDGSGDYVRSNDFEPGSSLGTMGWVKLDTLSEKQNFVGAGNEFYVWYNPDKSAVRFELRIGNSWTCDARIPDSEFSTGNWNMFTARYDGSTCEIILNNKSYTDSVSVSGSIDDNNNELTIGSVDDSNTGRDVDGHLDNTVVLGRWITDSEISNFYQCSKLSCNSAPSIDSVSTSPSSWTLNSDIDLSANVSDSDGTVSSVEADVWENGSQIVNDASLSQAQDGSWSISDLFTVDQSDVYYNMTLTATDDDGATSTYSEEQFINDDSPEISISKPQSIIYNSTNIDYDVDITSNNDAVPEQEVNYTITSEGKKVVSGTDTGDFNLQASFSEQEGQNITFKVEAEDSGGSTTKELDYEIDTTPPQIEILNPVERSEDRTNINLDVNITDRNLDNSECSYQINNQTKESLLDCENTTTQVSEVGNYSITVFAEDTVGNKDSKTVEPLIDYENTVQLEDAVSGSSISNFTVSLSQSGSSTGAGGSTTNGVFNFFTSEIPDGDVNMTLKADEYQTNTVLLENVDRSFTLDKTYSMERSGLYLKTFDEQDSSNQLDFDLTAVGLSSGDEYNEANLTKFEKDYADLPSGFPKGEEVRLTITDADSNYNDEINYDSYRPRQYVVDINKNTRTNLDAYLLERGSGIFVTVEVLDDSQEQLPEALVNIQRNIDGFKTVSSKKTQTDGTASFYLDPDSSYKALVSKTGFDSFSGTFSPVNYQTEPLVIALGSETEFIQSNVWDSIQYEIEPEGRRLNMTGNQTFNYTITDSESGLEEMGLRLYNESGSKVLEETITGTPSGTSVVAELDLNKYEPESGEELILRGFFVKDGELYKNEKRYIFRESLTPGPFSLESAFNSADGLGDMAKSILALLIVAITGSKLKTSINKKGGGLITLSVLGLFVVQGWFDSFTFLLTLVTLVGLYGTR